MPRKLIRVLFITHDSSLYGASLSLLTILEYLVKNQNFEILVLLPYQGKMELRLKELKVNYLVISYPRCVINKHVSLSTKILKLIKYYKNYYSSLPELTSIARKFSPNLIYSNTSVVSIGYILAHKMKLPHIWHIREYGDIDYNYIPSKKIVKHYINRSDYSIFISESLLGYWSDSWNKNALVVQNGIKTQVKSNRRSFPRSKIMIGLLGAIIPIKRQDVAINALSEVLKVLPNCELHIYGDIINRQYFNTLQKITIERNITNKVVFHQFQDDTHQIYCNLDVVLSCSSFEGFGRTIIEAMSYGIPVIANASAGPLEIISNYVDGLLFNNTSENLSKIMINLLSDKKLYENISRNGIEKFNRIYTAERSVNQINKIINSF